VDMQKLLAALTARFGMYAQGREIYLSFADDAPQVWADAAQLREVFANLLSNAVRYLDKEPGRVDISWRADGDSYIFSVTDNGPGIPDGIQARIFEPFVRGSVGEKDLSGTGLGLYFVKTIVEQAGGRVGVESTPGKGSRFWFTVRRVPPGCDVAVKDNEAKF